MAGRRAQKAVAAGEACTLADLAEAGSAVEDLEAVGDFAGRVRARETCEHKRFQAWRNEYVACDEE